MIDIIGCVFIVYMCVCACVKGCALCDLGHTNCSHRANTSAELIVVIVNHLTLSLFVNDQYKTMLSSKLPLSFL